MDDIISYLYAVAIINAIGAAWMAYDEAVDKRKYLAYLLHQRYLNELMRRV